MNTCYYYQDLLPGLVLQRGASTQPRVYTYSFHSGQLWAHQ